MSGYDDKAATEVEIMWTNQHGTGKKADQFVESQVILQYMCQAFPDGEVPLTNINTQFEHHTIRNGGTSSTQTFRANQRESSDVKLTLGLHEPYNYYQSYLRRERNKGRTFHFHPGEEEVCVCVCVCGGVLNKFLYREASFSGPAILPTYENFSYTFYSQMVPRSHTEFRTLNPF